MGDRLDPIVNTATSESDFIEVAALDQLPPGSALHVSIAGMSVALFNVDGRVVAIGDLCIRCGASLSSGILSGSMLSCGRCGWHYNLATGTVDRLPVLRIDTLELQVVQGRILLARSGLPSSTA